MDDCEVHLESIGNDQKLHIDTSGFSASSAHRTFMDSGTSLAYPVDAIHDLFVRAVSSEYTSYSSFPTYIINFCHILRALWLKYVDSYCSLSICTPSGQEWGLLLFYF
jgi:hypothetical protein